MNNLYEVSSKTIFEYLLKKRKHVIVGIENISIGCLFKLSPTLINHFADKYKGLISININRIFHDDNIENLKKVLNNINFDNINLIIYSDLGAYEVLASAKLNNHLCYDAYTYLTNTQDILEYSNFNKYVCVSNQISTQEIKEVLSKVNKKVILHGFGKSIIFYSKRKLLTNYFKYRKMDKNPYYNNYYLKEEFRDDKYHILEDEHGTYIFEKGYYLLNFDVISNDLVDFVMVCQVDMKNDDFKNVINTFEKKDISYLNDIANISEGIMESKSVLLKSEVKPHE